MSDAVVIPTWALGLISVFLAALLAIIRWALARFTQTVDTRLEKVEDAVSGVNTTVGGIDRRLIRVETILEDGGGTDPSARRLRVLTPPQGVPPVGS